MQNTENDDLFTRFLKIIDALNHYDVDYMVIGCVAMITHGMPRFTQDLDLLLDLSRENINRLQRALASLYDDPAIKEITLEDLNESAVIRYGTTDNFYLDLMARIGEVADFNSLQFEKRIISGVAVKIATAESLLLLKKNKLRPEDKRDCVFLEKLIRSKNNGKNAGI